MYRRLARTRRRVAVVVATLVVSAVPGPAATTAGAAEPLSIKVNFQPDSAVVPAGYLKDGGAVYGNRGNGQTYGWNVTNTANTRDRNSSTSPDQRYDTLNHMQANGGNAGWEIAVPNGSYSVRVVSGDPSWTNSVYKLNVEGVPTVDGTPTAAQPWIEGTKTVTVADGKLTVSNAPGSSNNKINFIEIGETGTAPPPDGFVAKVNFQPNSAAVPAGYVKDAGAVYGNRGNGLTYGWNVDNSANTRDRNSAASPDQRYDTLNHMQANGADASWDIAVPNGSYSVRVVAGDPGWTNSVYKLNVEGVPTVDGTPSTAQKWIEGTKTVTVADGKLTVSNAPGSSNNKINFIEIGAPEPEGCGALSTLRCSEILVAAPYVLDFTAGRGKLPDRHGEGTGFTMVMPSTNGTGSVPAAVDLQTASPGILQLTTTAGSADAAQDAQDNMLGVGVDAGDQISLVSGTLSNPAAGGAGEAGVFYGIDEDNHLKLVTVTSAAGIRIRATLETAGAIGTTFESNLLPSEPGSIVLSLKADPAPQTVVASYRRGGGTAVDLGTFSPPDTFFNFDAAGIDPRVGTRVFAGILANHQGSDVSRTVDFDEFSLTAVGTPPPPGGFTFTRTSFPVPSPTSMAWGPDGRLYVSELLGKIHAVTLGADRQPVSDQVITTLGQRLTLGVAVDPASTPANMILWVAHSHPDLTNNAPINSSIVSRLSGPGLTTREDVITGLPRSKANHAINSLHFGPDGRLYIAAGGNTGAGAHNSGNSEFGDRPEQPLSAALLVADVKAAGFDGTCAMALGTFGPPPCDVTLHATGLRNMYDFVWHSNGSLYAPDNGLGVLGTFPPQPTPVCTGPGNTALWTDGGHNPGIQPDTLLRLEQGKYYGHPNPYRNECVFGDGHYQGVAPLPNYVPPMFNLGNHKSSNAIIEYRASAFGGALNGSLLTTNYSVGDDITRLVLSADGRTVTKSEQLAGGFSDPLPLVQGSDGALYVGEFSGNRVTVLVPAQAAGTWTTKAPLPVALLDAGGAALNGKVYVVAGKTSAGPQKTLRIYDPGTNTWATGPSLPAAYPAVENPAVVAHSGKLYAFGGSTGPFSGATTAAAVFDPATSAWSMLAAMPVARSGATAQVLGTKIYVAGGMDAGGTSLASMSVFDPATNTWATGAAMAVRRDNPGSAALGGKLYVFGGRTRNADGTTPNATLNSTEVFDPGTNTWTAAASMPTGRRAVAVGTLGGRAQVIGGENIPGGGAFAANEEYDPGTNTWRTLAPMPTARHGAAVGTLGTAVYVIGGGNTGDFSAVNQAFSL